MYNRTYNFSAGPATMPVPVLEEIRDELLNYRGAGMGVMEMSHRSKVFQTIIDEAEQDLRDLMGIPDLFLQHGRRGAAAGLRRGLCPHGQRIWLHRQPDRPGRLQRGQCGSGILGPVLLRERRV